MFNFFKSINNKVNVHPTLRKFNKVFEENGYEAYLVGGVVRDLFLNKEAHDWDVATNAPPEEVMKMFKVVIPTGIEHGTVTVHFMKKEIEVTTYRTESDYSDGRHPDKVNYARTIEEDLSRRDFTINAIAINLKDGRIKDPFHGRRDIKKKLIQTVGKAEERFNEDGLRPIRAIRFASKLGFTIKESTYKEISNPQIMKKIQMISIERFRDEFEKLLQSDKPSVGLYLLEDTGLLNLFIPEFSKCRHCIQSDYRGFHKFDVLDHLYYACDGAPKNKLNVRLAALFHDIGKPTAKSVTETEVLDGENNNQPKKLETITFYNHEKYSAEITKKIMTRLKFSNDMINNVCHLVKEHMFHYEESWTDAAVRRFIIRAKYECLEDLFDLRLADMYGMFNEKIEYRYSKSVHLLMELKERIEKIMKEQNALSLKDLAVNGKDLMSKGIPSGKKLGLILNKLLDAVLEDPNLNSKEKLLEIAVNLNTEF